MSRWRVMLVLALLGAPFLSLAGFGSYFLWREGWSLLVWWPMALCMILGYFLAWHWQRKNKLLRPVDFEPPIEWTQRDRQAWKLVETRVQTPPPITAEHLGEVQFYVDLAQEMGMELARFYHPAAQDPIGSATVPEILAVVELAAHDLAEMVDQYLPAGHLLTVDHWRQAKKMTDWYPAFRNVYWVVSAFFSPVNTAMRLAASEAGMARPWQMFQQNLVLWFYTAYVHRLGTYLIELNSGRLRVGAKRYRELRQPADASPAAAAAVGADQVTIAVLGQVKAGKSSLINALLGEQKAQADVNPATASISRYELRPPDVPGRLILLDTVGYGNQGPTEDQLRATEEAARHADLLILVLHACNPARQTDANLLGRLRAWFASQPDLNIPLVLGVMTHIDLLSPALEWSPPYDWRRPRRLKEEQIHEAVVAVREQLGDSVAAVVPVCTALGKLHGVEDDVLPALVDLLGEARAVALLRCLRSEAHAGKVRKVFQQLVKSGGRALDLWLQSKSGKKGFK